MSQHYIICQRNGHNVLVTLGYDWQLNHFFLNVEQDGLVPGEAFAETGNFSQTTA